MLAGGGPGAMTLQGGSSTPSGSGLLPQRAWHIPGLSQLGEPSSNRTPLTAGGLGSAPERQGIAESSHSTAEAGQRKDRSECHAAALLGEMTLTSMLTRPAIPQAEAVVVGPCSPPVPGKIAEKITPACQNKM